MDTLEQHFLVQGERKAATSRSKHVLQMGASHEGIPQNELADRLAGAAGQRIEGNSPQNDQPLLTCSVPSSLVKAAAKEQLQER